MMISDLDITLFYNLIKKTKSSKIIMSTNVCIWPNLCKLPEEDL